VARLAPEGSESAETDRLLARAEAGDRAAVESLFGGHRDYLHRMIDLRMDQQLRSRIDVSDVIQEAHVEASRRIGDFLRRRPMPFALWLRQTAYECLLRLRRQHVEAQQRAVGREVPLPERSSVLLAGAAMSASATPSEQLIEQELARRVREAMAQLPDDDREILLMRNFEELSNQEVAQVLGLEPGTASKRYMRALFRLREVLVANGLTESQT
jgi:RNA polymerase sigma-70 factor (ECF subfamily)